MNKLQSQDLQKNPNISSRSNKSKQRKMNMKENMRNGLSPGKEYDKGMDDSDSIKTCSAIRGSSKESSACGLFDRTQWERTRFSEEAAIDKRRSVEIIIKPLEADGSSKKCATLFNETKQKMMVRGEYLKKKPRLTITLLIIEVVSYFPISNPEGISWL
ncbi:hypothetical protein DICVIV_10916 [Dictyocaulus viviparus]|uniref:Uncharacterized protein n=1 Tax=Dictyocaulus viviparus TaxID=29172 RepID=A0A0D8XEP9_DICVI|nr:hypothetical protein DICVIV_10916 [Dictyocaulus viviparus]